MPEDKPVVLLVDETGLNDRLKAMGAAVVFAGKGAARRPAALPQRKETESLGMFYLMRVRQ